MHLKSTSIFRFILPLIFFTWMVNLPVYSAGFTTHIDSSELDVRFYGTTQNVDEEKFQNWINESANVVSSFYGKFPVDQAQVDLTLFEGGGLTGGRAYGDHGARVTVTVGIYNEAEDLRKDWRLIHELIHLAFPRVPRENHWIVEGLATYLESVSRCQAGQIDPVFMWRGFQRGMPNGLPQSDEIGLDGSTRWGRIFWGGALFALYADIGIRQQTQNQKSLVDALNGILDAGLDHRDESELLPLLKIADEATGTTVMQQLYTSAGNKNWNPDLDKLWLGLGLDNPDSFNDSAKLVYIRDAITSPRQKN